MPVFALFEDDRRHVRDVPFGEDAYCPVCSGRVRKWRKSETGTIAHFKHIEGMGKGRSGGGSTDCITVHESEEHEHWKHLAVTLLDALYGDFGKATEELPLSAPISDKDHRKADAAITFNQPHKILGRGVIIEVQHKNESKDIVATTADYIAQDYAVVWTYADDYDRYKCKLDQTDLEQRAFETAFKHAWPRRTERENIDQVTAHIQNGLDATSDDAVAGTDAILPTAWVDQTAKRLWNQREWPQLFPDSESVMRPCRDLFGDPMTKQIVTQYPADKYINEVRETCTLPDRWELRLPDEAVDNLMAELFRSQRWINLFPDRMIPEGEQYIRKLLPTPELVVVPVQLPGPIIKQIELKRNAPNPPPTLHEDIQCFNCGHYWYVGYQRGRCRNCGEPIDFEWNVETGRISPDNIQPELRPK